MNSQLLIASGVVQNTAIESLTTGQLGLYGIDTASMQTINLSPTSKVDTMWMALGKANGKALLTREIKDIQNRNFTFKKMPYRDAVKETTVVTTDCLGTSIYDEFIVKITASALYDGFEGLEYFSKSFSVTGKLTSFLALYQALAAEITTPDVPLVFSATGTASGLEIVAHEGMHLNISLTVNKDESDTCAPCAFCESITTTTNVAATRAEWCSSTIRNVAISCSCSCSNRKKYGCQTSSNFMQSCYIQVN